MRYQAKEAKEEIGYLLESADTDIERTLLKEIEKAIDQLDFDTAEMLMKRWEGQNE